MVLAMEFQFHFSYLVGLFSEFRVQEFFYRSYESHRIVIMVNIIIYFRRCCDDGLSLFVNPSA